MDEFFIGYAPPMPPGSRGSSPGRDRARRAASWCGRSPSRPGTCRSRAAPSSSDIRGRFPGRSSSALPGAAARWRRSSARRPGRSWSRLASMAPTRLVRGLDGRHVTLTGTRIAPGHAHDDRGRARVARRWTRRRQRRAMPAESVGGGPVTVSGEIVDSKCFLGVMVPGAGKTHKECASLCLRGGIPPAPVRAGSSRAVVAAAPDRAVRRADRRRRRFRSPVRPST